MGWVDVAFLALILVLVIVDMAADAHRDARTVRSLSYLVGMHQLETEARKADTRRSVPGARHKLAPAYERGDGWHMDCACGWGAGPLPTAEAILDAGQAHIERRAA